MKNILFVAPPAGGKGTISAALVEDYGYVHISTGDLLREIDKTTPLGREIDELISNGKFVSDDLVLELLKNKLKTIGDKPFILDGCPRNVTQAEKIKDIFKELDIHLDIVIELAVPYDILLKRATGRLICSGCKTTFNKYFKTPLKDGICDKCGNELISRSDDNEETFKSRFDTYMESTAPLIDYYKKEGILVTVDGVENAYENVVSVIAND